VRVRFLGSGDAFGSGGRLQTCILLESGDFRCLVDCGASSLIALKRAAIDPNDIDTLLITHLHGDHFGGIPFLVLDGQFARRSRRLLVAGPPGVAERVTQLMEVFFPGSSKTQRKFETEFLEIVGGTPVTIGPLRVTPYEVVHGSGALPYALRIELGGFTIGYSGDTDVFISEAYFYDKPVRFHLNYETLVHRRSQLRCKRLIVTHMGRDMLAHVARLPVEAAYDGMEVSL